MNKPNILNFDLAIKPLFFLIIATFVGEASLSVIGIPIYITSSVLYIIMLITFLLLIATKSKFAFKMNLVYMFYMYILIRNITINKIVIIDYWLPNFVTLILLIFIGSIKLSKIDIKNIIMYIYYFSGILVLLGAIKSIFIGGRLYVFGGPNGFYKFAIMFEIFSYMYLLQTKKKKYIIYIITAIFTAIMTGSKGAIVEIIIIIPIQYLYYLTRNNTNIYVIFKRLFLLLVISLTLIIISRWLTNYNSLFSSSYQRGIGGFSSNVNELTSVSARLKLINLSILYFKRNPIFGMGGSFMRLDTMDTYDPQPYAHNIFFEVLGEQGIVGFVILIWVFISVILKFKKKTLKDVKYFCLYLAMLDYFIGAQLSGGILDSKVIFFFIILIYRYYILKKQNIVNKTKQ